jgi:hypothetical protein
MLDWFKPRPKPPVDTWYKAWTETRMLWLADQFGCDRMLKARVLRPVEEDFPGPYRGTDDDARGLMECLCDVMGVDPHRVELEIVEDQQIPGAAGHYDALESGRSIIRIARSRLAEFQGLVATLAHELAHELLLGRGLLTAEVDDHELITDLLPVFLGLGIFTANATIFDHAKHRGNRQIRQHGYLPSHVLGYALALFAHVRGEGEPEWCEYLRLDAATALRAGLKYLEKTGDTLFDRASVRSQSRDLGPRTLVDRLRTGTPSSQLAALWQLRKDGPAGSDQVDAVLSLLDDRDECLRIEAAWIVGAHALAPDRAPGLLSDALRSRDGSTRATAAWALGQFPAQAEAIIPRLIPLLEDSEDPAVLNAAGSLGRFGLQAQEAAGTMLEALTRALIDCKMDIAEVLASSLNQVTPDLQARLKAYFAELDPELMPLAREAFGLPERSGDETEPDEESEWDEEIDHG